VWSGEVTSHYHEGSPTIHCLESEDDRKKILQAYILVY